MSENAAKIQNLKSDISRISLQLRDLNEDKKAQVNSYKELIKARKNELEVLLDELQGLQVKG